LREIAGDSKKNYRCPLFRQGRFKGVGEGGRGNLSFLKISYVIERHSEQDKKW